MDEIIAAICGGCAAICTTSCQTFCNTRSYGTDATCADNCCRFNCGWKRGQLPVEDYPIPNSQPEDGTAAAADRVAKEGEDASLPAYTATPQMSAAPPTAAAEANGNQPTQQSTAGQTTT